jgi:hypothetical protein
MSDPAPAPAPTSASALRYACDELLAASTPFDVKRTTRALWWITQIVGRAVPGDPVCLELEGASYDDLIPRRAKEIVALALLPTAPDVDPALMMSATVAAVLALGMLGHTTVGLRYLKRLGQSADVFEWLCKSSAIGCLVSPTTEAYARILLAFFRILCVSSYCRTLTGTELLHCNDDGRIRCEICGTRRAPVCDGCTNYIAAN